MCKSDELQVAVKKTEKSGLASWSVVLCVFQIRSKREGRVKIYARYPSFLLASAGLRTKKVTLALPAQLESNNWASVVTISEWYFQASF